MKPWFKLLLCTFFIFPAVFSQFKVVGYIHPPRNQPLDLSNVSFEKLTHLNIAFVNPDSLGNLVAPPGFDTLVRKAQDAGVKVLASIGGGSHNPYIGGLLADASREAFTRSLLQFCAEHRLDGLDVDLENDAIDSNYNAFIGGLSDGLKKNNKLMSAALATWNGETIPNFALGKFDFINVMSYDETGPWRPEKPGPHASFQKAEADLQYWTIIRGVPAENLNLGVPFYGYCFGTKYGASMSYADIIANFPGADSLDMIMPDGGGVIHYNGATTIQQKTRLAMSKAGGLMIWQILHDAPGDRSLLLAIDKLVKGNRNNR
jgi:GH18 family chitinase